MSLQKIGAVNAMYPSLTVIAGALVNGKPNWITIAHVGIMSHGELQTISLGMNKIHHTNQGIFAQKTFSVNLPSVSMLKETDYLGLVSGARHDKSEFFKVFYGDLGTAPMIAECPVCMECRLERVVDFPNHDVFVGEIVQTWAKPEVLEDGKVHYGRVDPLLFDFQRIRYWSLGQEVGRPWHDGKELKPGRGAKA